ncbi:MAG: DUF2064 domain-containing protein [Pseudomonadota bacterium]
MTAVTLKAATSGHWRSVLAIDPPSAVGAHFPCWSGAHERCVQISGDLGARLSVLFACAPPGPVAIIGADAPRLRQRHIASAFRALAGADAVFGPADDGGFWLVGLARRRAPPRLMFEGVRWSTRHALNDAVNSLPSAYGVQRIEKLNDVDDGPALKRIGTKSLNRSMQQIEQ